jgi:hypothetical protein
MSDALRRATSALEKHKRTLRQIGHQLIQGFEQFQHPQNAQ